MLGFSTTNGVKIKGSYARSMRAAVNRMRSGRLNKTDLAALKFQQEHSPITLVRVEE